MDIFSLTVGFVVGAITGAAGHYLGEKYTDKRRSKELASAVDEEWADLEKRFPKVIAEMKENAKHTDFVSVRYFFVKSSRTTVSRSEPAFEYHTDVHSDLSAAIAHLEEIGYIVDVTPGNCPMYRMREQFVDKLRSN
ncbi:hypothetical protein SAMN05660443_2513 [Marinospirillum celere]|uniref:Uncharacterized protein n=1 Tax=Marinospirillum celere TaxID=1122252 RepID=A0A1I1IZG7_9GAMM|nr:hypothetical protein [Marinospirillum celere]SFC39778.1 hypothetical protein SAMN05660443_2513 [Marinospirillum celere]